MNDSAIPTRNSPQAIPFRQKISGLSLVILSSIRRSLK